LILTGRLFHGVLVETNATNVVAPVELNEAVVWLVRAVPFRYPLLVTTVGVEAWPNAETAERRANTGAKNRNLRWKITAIFLRVE